MFSIKTSEEIAIMAEGGAILRRVATTLAETAKEGVRLKELDVLAKKLMEDAGGTPAFLNYKPAWAAKPYKASICASVNDVIVHGIPGKYALKSGDVLKLDLGLKYRDFHTDTAVTVGIGTISDEAKRLIAVTRDALLLALDQCVIGNTVGDIGFAVHSYVRKNGFHVAKGLTGHGIGRALHEDPVVLNEGKPKTGMRLVRGMALAIEPMVCAGNGGVKELDDESFTTMDGGLSAHFEHTIAITEDGPRILT